MSTLINKNLDYDSYVKIADDVYWVGYADIKAGLQCNPYLIIDEGEGILIDGGSRPDFSAVMMKVLSTGIKPESISYLIYQHSDPDLCGSIANFEDVINREDLKILSQKDENIFISYYYPKSELICIEDIESKLTLSSGRTLRFYKTPYAHNPGSFITFDEKTGILFTSDIFGSYLLDINKWDLFLGLSEDCRTCGDLNKEKVDCKSIDSVCPLPHMLQFHRKVMTSNKALSYAMKQVSSIKPKMIAPQHGSVIHREQDISFIIDTLEKLSNVGIDGVPDIE
jgi:flavorubredoxin